MCRPPNSSPASDTPGAAAFDGRKTSPRGRTRCSVANCSNRRPRQAMLDFERSSALPCADADHAPRVRPGHGIERRRRAGAFGATRARPARSLRTSRFTRVTIASRHERLAGRRRPDPGPALEAIANAIPALRGAPVVRAVRRRHSTGTGSRGATTEFAAAISARRRSPRVRDVARHLPAGDRRRAPRHLAAAADHPRSRLRESARVVARRHAHRVRQRPRRRPRPLRDARRRFRPYAASWRHGAKTTRRRGRPTAAGSRGRTSTTRASRSGSCPPTAASRARSCTNCSRSVHGQARRGRPMAGASASPVPMSPTATTSTST